MAIQLMKLNVTVSTSTVTTPTDTRFFYVTDAQTDPENTLTIDAADFFDDDGAAVVTLPTLTADNSYFNVYVNGVLQMEGINTYTPGATGVGQLEIAVPAGGEPILAQTPVVLEVMNYAPVSTNTVTT
jgi:hypothetical protein